MLLNHISYYWDFFYWKILNRVKSENFFQLNVKQMYEV